MDRGRGKARQYTQPGCQLQQHQVNNRLDGTCSSNLSRRRGSQISTRSSTMSGSYTTTTGRYSYLPIYITFHHNRTSKPFTALPVSPPPHSSAVRLTDQKK